jgi:hypothetical protein
VVQLFRLFVDERSALVGLVGLGGLALELDVRALVDLDPDLVVRRDQAEVVVLAGERAAGVEDVQAVLGELDLDHELVRGRLAHLRLGVDHPRAVGLLLQLGLLLVAEVVVVALPEVGVVDRVDLHGGDGVVGRRLGGGVLAGGRGEREGRNGGASENDACGTSHDEPHFLLEGKN